jgi:YD repeat-containing protein
VANGYVASDFVYDAANRLTRRTDAISGRTFVTGFTPDGNGNVTDVAYPSGHHVQYAYDSENRITSVTDAGRGLTFATAITYHPSGGIGSYTSGDGVGHTIEYDARYRPSRIAAGNILDLRYAEYDGAGNLMTLTDALRPAMSATFAYDALDRLTTGSGGGWGAIGYSYDPVGNRVAKTANGATTSYTYDSQNRLASTGGAEAESFGYDDNGNLTVDTRGQYTYTPANVLATA